MQQAGWEPAFESPRRERTGEGHSGALSARYFDQTDTRLLVCMHKMRRAAAGATRSRLARRELAAAGARGAGCCNAAHSPPSARCHNAQPSDILEAVLRLAALSVVLRLGDNCTGFECVPTLQSCTRSKERHVAAKRLSDECNTSCFGSFSCIPLVRRGDAGTRKLAVMAAGASS